MFGKIIKYFTLDSIGYGAIGLPINIYTVGNKQGIGSLYCPGTYSTRITNSVYPISIVTLTCNYN